MIFDSFQFAIFFIIVYGIYLCLKHRAQNHFLLLASYFFYGFWSWKFLALLITTQIIDFQISKALGRDSNQIRRKRLLWLSVAVNMGTLAFFKYFNFFTENLQDVLRLFDTSVSPVTLNIVLPVGISFYTIQELTYIIDVYKKRVRPAKRFVDFSLFVSFFPQLVAGPIERAERLMPQVESPRKINWEDLTEGTWLIFWGLFKKMFIADRLALLVDPVFSSPDAASAPTIIIAALAFTVQIYADFSGYSDMAVGLGRVMGFRLMYNFKLPFFAVSPSDFWKRWHISLSQCLRDNLYIPMGGNRNGFSRELFALMTTMLIGGLWHGAKWHFVLWGFYCGCLLVAQRLLQKLLKIDLNLPATAGRLNPRYLFQAGSMFCLTVVGFVIFRVANIKDIWVLIGKLTSYEGTKAATIHYIQELAICTGFLIFYQFAHHISDNRFFIFRIPNPIRVVIYIGMYLLLAIGAPHDSRQFIYFQF